VAVAGAYAFFKSEGKVIDIEQFGANLLRRGEAKLIAAHPPN